MALEVGNSIPDFKTTNQKGEIITNNDLSKGKTVLYFYPKDDTPGCTAQACNLRDNYDALLKDGFTIYGISPDGEKKHQKFIEKYDLPFDLLVDEDHSIAEAFGVWVEKNMYGRKYMGIARTTFVIDDSGTITEVIAKVKTKDHTAQLMG